jgi:site-specific DNA-methyltransferase (adenine-specific)
VRDYGGYRRLIEANGLNLGDIWDDVSPVRHASTKYRKANELPRLLTDRVIAISGSPGTTLVDPFAGSGSMVISAAGAGMHFLANDLVQENCLLIEKRLAGMNSASGGKQANASHS